MKRSGFTLIEISIVLVIIGLIVGGVLAGRQLIENAIINKQLAMPAKVETAVHTFRLKYNCIPGDCLTATSKFGSACTTNGGSTYETAETGTCNGNGDGIAYTNASAPTIVQEEFFLQHQLTLARLWYYPWDMNKYPADSFTGMVQRYDYDNNFWWPGRIETPVWLVPAPYGSTKSAAFIALVDTKYDDGVGSTGRMTVNPEDIDTSDPLSCVDASGQYQTTSGTISDCTIYFDLKF